MKSLTETQKLLVSISEDCAELGSIIARYLNDPDCVEIAEKIKKLKEKINKYLNQLYQN